MSGVRRRRTVAVHASPPANAPHRIQFLKKDPFLSRTTAAKTTLLDPGSDVKVKPSRWALQSIEAAVSKPSIVNPTSLLVTLYGAIGLAQRTSKDTVAGEWFGPSFGETPL